MNLQQLYYFEAVARLKNYTKAADELFTTQSCLSHSLGDLERELSIALFTRRGRSIEVTEFGASFLEHTTKILSELEKIKQEQKNILATHEGTIRISFTANMGHRWIPSLIQDFRKLSTNQNISFSFTEMQATKKAIEELKQNAIDIAFGAKIEDPLINYHYIGSEELFAVVKRDSSFAHRKEFKFQDISSQTLITYNYNCGTRYFVDSLLKKHNVMPENIVEMETEKMIVSAVSAGMGFAIVPLIHDLDHYNVTNLRFDTGNTYRPLYMMWKNEAYINPLIRNFISFVKKRSALVSKAGNERAEMPLQ